MVDCFEYLKNCGLPIVVYGMGDGGDKVINALESREIKVSAVMASDGFVRGQSFHGFKVKTLASLEAELPDFAIALAFGSSLPQVMDNIIAVSDRHTLRVPCVPVFGEQIFDLEFARSHKKELFEVYGLLADVRSREVFENIIYFQLTGELKYLLKATDEKDEAFNNILKLKKDENYLDLGAYRGDTIAEFLYYSQNNANTENFCGNITALEPDKKTFKKLTAFAENFYNTRLINKGIWLDDAVLNFSAKSGRNSSLAGENGIPTEVTSIDSLSQEYKIKFSYIKMDVEGAEYDAISGGENVLLQYKPKLNIALYHRAADIYRLVLLVHKLNPKYKLYIRHHPYIPFWDTNLYAI